MLGELYDRLAECDVVLELTEAHQQVRELLRAEGMEARFGKITRRTTCNGLLEDWFAQHAHAQQTAILRGPA
jgi:hypothetical protein